MKAVINSKPHVNTLIIRNLINPQTLKDKSLISLLNIKFYQMLVIAFILFSTFLIFPESPKELEILCRSYHSKHVCNVW